MKYLVIIENNHIYMILQGKRAIMYYKLKKGKG